jgi:hypothetical protein
MPPLKHPCVPAMHKVLITAHVHSTELQLCGLLPVSMYVYWLGSSIRTIFPCLVLDLHGYECRARLVPEFQGSSLIEAIPRIGIVLVA